MFTNLDVCSILLIYRPEVIYLWNRPTKRLNARISIDFPRNIFDSYFILHDNDNNRKHNLNLHLFSFKALTFHPSTR